MNDLLYMVNLGCIEINPWNSRVEKLDFPDYAIIDLDPADVGFNVVIETALAVRDVLDACGVTAFPKTSGATGMHIYIPLHAKYSYEDARRFTELLVRLVHQKLPNVTSLERSPAKRRGKVYLDYLQNVRGQTLAAPYSIRPRPQAPVSTPLLWKEIGPKLHPTRFTIKNIFDRIEKHGDLWKGVLGEGVDIPAILDQLENFYGKTKKNPGNSDA